MEFIEIKQVHGILALACSLSVMGAMCYSWFKSKSHPCNRTDLPTKVLRIAMEWICKNDFKISE